MSGSRKLSKWQLAAIRRRQAASRVAAEQQRPIEGEPSMRELRDANQERIRRERGGLDAPSGGE